MRGDASTENEKGFEQRVQGVGEVEREEKDGVVDSNQRGQV